MPTYDAALGSKETTPAILAPEGSTPCPSAPVIPGLGPGIHAFPGNA